MYNQKRVKIVRIGAMIGIATVSLAIGGAIGYSFSGSSSTSNSATVETISQKEDRLSSEMVKEFLITYYTRKDLSENRDRYQELMTDAMYRQQVSEEESPVSQAYKGYVLNQVFDKATIYIDETSLTALAEVDYHNVQTTKKNNPDVGVRMNEKATLKITFMKQKDRYLVSRIEQLGSLLQKAVPTNDLETVNTSEEPTTTQNPTTQTTTTQGSSQEVEQEEQQTFTLRGRLW